MNLSFKILALAASTSSVAVRAQDTNPSAPLYVPTRISFEELSNDSSSSSDSKDDPFWKTLREVGLLSITNVPDLNKHALLKDLQDCLHSPNHEDNAIGAPDVGAYGNRRRRTLATHTLEGSPRDIFLAVRNKDLCPNLQSSSQKFRTAVQTVSEAVAKRFGTQASRIETPSGDRISVQTVINEGEHLEHFHSYYSSQDTGKSKSATTIDWHTDQGMMLLFTPGQQSDGTISGDFFIRLQNGSSVKVDFDSQKDDIVLMLGDGVNQYIQSNNSHNLRAVPHTLALQEESQEARLWYGRMVLPPPNAVHPHSTRHETFGDLRSSMIRGEKDALQLGCASVSMMARELMEDMDMHANKEDADEEPPLTCDEDTSMLCWMRCMNHTDFDISPASCQDQGEELQCANEAGDLWVQGIHNPDFSLRCLSAKSMDMDMDMGNMDGSSSSLTSSYWMVSAAMITFGLAAMLL